MSRKLNTLFHTTPTSLYGRVMNNGQHVYFFFCYIVLFKSQSVLHKVIKKKKTTHTDNLAPHSYLQVTKQQVPTDFLCTCVIWSYDFNFLNSSQIRNDIVIKSLIQTTGSSDYLNKSNGRCDLTFIQFPSYNLSFNLQLDPIYFLTCRNGKKKKHIGGLKLGMK